MSAIVLQGVSLSRSGLRDIDLAIAAGELVALVGPSGAGKSSLLRLVAGLAVPDAGRITIGDADVSGVPAERRGIGFVFQGDALFPHMDVAGNVGFGLAVRAAPPSPADIDAAVTRLLGLVQLDGFGTRRPATLSGGERQRVALARALATEPRILLLDEPFGALDTPARRDLRRALRDLHDRLGRTTLLVTHDHDEAIELGDRIVALDGGRIVPFAG